MTDKELTILQRESYACLDRLEDAEVQCEKAMKNSARKFTKIIKDTIEEKDMNTVTEEEMEKLGPPKKVLMEMVIELQRAGAKSYDQIEALKLKVLLLEKSWNLPAVT